MKKSLKKRERLAIFFRYLRRNKPLFKKAKEAHSFLCDKLIQIEIKYCRSIDVMFLIPFDSFYFDVEKKVYYWEAHRHIIFINEHGSFGIYKTHIAPELVRAVAWDFYVPSNALALCLNPLDQTLW